MGVQKQCFWPKNCCSKHYTMMSRGSSPRGIEQGPCNYAISVYSFLERRHIAHQVFSTGSETDLWLNPNSSTSGSVGVGQVSSSSMPQFLRFQTRGLAGNSWRPFQALSFTPSWILPLDPFPVSTPWPSPLTLVLAPHPALQRATGPSQQAHLVRRKMSLAKACQEKGSWPPRAFWLLVPNTPCSVLLWGQDGPQPDPVQRPQGPSVTPEPATAHPSGEI